MSLNANGSSFSITLPKIRGVDNKTGMDTIIEEKQFYSSTDLNNPDSIRKAFLNLMLEYACSEHFEQSVRNLSSLIQLNVIYNVNTSI